MSHRVPISSARSLAASAALAAAVAGPAIAQQPTPQALATVNPVVGTIGMNQQVTSALALGGATWDGKPIHQYDFSCTAGQSFRMDILSAWDNYALVFDPSGNIVARDDDSGGSGNARITYTCLLTGVYRLGVTAYSSSTTTGQYTLQVQQASGASQIVGQVTPGSIALNQQVTGVLAPGGATWDGKPIQLYSLSCAAGQAFQMDVLSSWDNYAVVLDPANNVAARDDDSGGDRNARITYTCPVTGVYQLGVTAYSTSTTTGQYTLQVRAASAPQAVAPAVMTPGPAQPVASPLTSAVVGTIGLNQQVTAALAAGGATWDGKPIHQYNFSCTVGQTFQMDIVSSWDNYALVFDPVGNIVARDDDSGGDSNARITYTCTATGIYRLGVTAYSTSTSTGQYTLQVRAPSMK